MLLEARARRTHLHDRHGALFPETYQAWRALEDRYGVRVEVFDAIDPTGVPWSAGHCCSERKTAALDAALAGLDAWITGLRREQATPSSGAELAYDERRGVWKASPLANWSERDVWNYIERYDLPYNALHDAATARSAAPRARFPATAGGNAGPAARRPSAASISRAEAVDMQSTSLQRATGSSQMRSASRAGSTTHAFACA